MDFVKQRAAGSPPTSSPRISLAVDHQPPHSLENGGACFGALGADRQGPLTKNIMQHMRHNELNIG